MFHTRRPRCLLYIQIFSSIFSIDNDDPFRGGSPQFNEHRIVFRFEQFNWNKSNPFLWFCCDEHYFVFFFIFVDILGNGLKTPSRKFISLEEAICAISIVEFSVE